MKEGRDSDTVALDRTDREGLSEEAGHYGDLNGDREPARRRVKGNVLEA